MFAQLRLEVINSVTSDGGFWIGTRARSVCVKGTCTISLQTPFNVLAAYNHLETQIFSHEPENLPELYSMERVT